MRDQQLANLGKLIIQKATATSTIKEALENLTETEQSEIELKLQKGINEKLTEYKKNHPNGIIDSHEVYSFINTQFPVEQIVDCIQLNNRGMNEVIKEIAQNCKSTFHKDEEPSDEEVMNSFQMIESTIEYIFDSCRIEKHNYGIISDALMLKQSKKKYYEFLWRIHHDGKIKDMYATGNARELIDFYCPPVFCNKESEHIVYPFTDGNCRKYVKAGSGFGKTTLLKSIILCCTIDYLLESGSTCISQNSIEKKKDYDVLLERYFHNTEQKLFPVFIDASNYKDESIKDIIKMAEGSHLPQFEELVNEANENGTLLFLIDAIDEIESALLKYFLDGLEEMLKKRCPNARVIITSRYLGSKKLPIITDILYIKSLDIESINRITHCILSENKALILIDRLKKEYWKTLASNPFMLLVILENRNIDSLCDNLEQIIEAIIYRRWDKSKYEIETEDVKLLLGVLACSFIFGKTNLKTESRKGITEADIHKILIKHMDDSAFNGYDQLDAEKIVRFTRFLSSQSGILIFDEEGRIEKVRFQDELVMCWLAGNYLRKMLITHQNVSFSNGVEGYRHNALLIDQFISMFARKESELSKKAVISLILILVMNEERGQDVQFSVLYYLIFRYSVSLSKTEIENIVQGLVEVKEGVFGTNDVINNPKDQIYKNIDWIIKNKDAMIKAREL